MPDTQWFADCGWGVFCHYLANPPSTKTNTPLSAEAWNQQVDAFDVDGLAQQLEAVKAPYFFITIGQGSGHFCAPSDTYDKLTGITPSKCSQRDLVADLHAALAPRGIKLLVYSAAEIGWGDAEARPGLKLTHHHSDPDSGGTKIWRRHRQVAFMKNIEAIHREWSIRWGNKVAGWWIDGCYEEEYRFPDDKAPNFKTFADSLRAGNRDAIVCFNTGVRTPISCTTQYEDYTAGEIADALPESPGAWIDKQGHKARYHVLSYLGDYWCKGAPRFPTALVTGYTEHVMSKGGVMTWDVPIAQNGLIPEAFIQQLAQIRKPPR
ncbi:MAG: hypothetical protein PF961_21315 [Planctomycetota bacterium]|jgi:alpha-L-fucosidase|nr:hypothetical protein [Planctomycetota bacterium]